MVIVLNYFCHEFETVSCTYPYFKIASFSPYRINHLNELIQISPSYFCIYMALPFRETQTFPSKKFKTHFTHSKSNQIIYERWMTIEWCWKTLTRKYFLFQSISWFCVFDFYCQFESLKCNRLHVWILGEIIRASFLLDVHLCKNDDSWPQ